MEARRSGQNGFSGVSRARRWSLATRFRTEGLDPGTVESKQLDCLGVSGTLYERYIHLGVTTRGRGVHSGGYLADMALQNAPLGISRHDNCNGSALEILLRCHILGGRQEYFKPGFLGGFEQFPVNELVPSGVLRFGDGVA